MIEKILVPTDGSGHADKALIYASDLAVKYEAELYLMHAVQESKIPDGFDEFLKAEKIEKPEIQVYLENVGKRIVEAAKKKAKSKGLDNVETTIAIGDPTDEILKFAKAKDVDLIVLGSRGLGGIKSVFLGSVSSKVCHQSDCTCMTVN
jgi:nucleotide-binding universal stress UspA family protein